MKQLLIFCFALYCTCSYGQAISDKLNYVGINEVTVGGEIGRRYMATLENNLLKLDLEKDFLQSFRKKDDSGYIGLGKLIDGTVRMAACTGDERVMSVKKHLTGEIIKAQGKDGYIGNMSPANRMWKLWDIHESGYIIYGLLTDYRYFGEKESLKAAEKAASFIIDRWKSMPPGWESETTVKEHVAITGLHRTMLELYRATGNKKYLDFCINELHLADAHPDIVVGRRNLIEGHIYGFMALCLAQLELYRIKPDENLLETTAGALKFMTSGDGMSITGATGQAEIWTCDLDGRGDLGESCATVYQLRIYDNLLRLRKDSRYGDMMERTIYNALFAAQSPDGRQIRYFTPVEGNRVYHNGDTYCCPCNYRRFISELPSMIWYRSDKGFAVNLYTESSLTASTAGGIRVLMHQETDYPASGEVVISVDPSSETSFVLDLRIPLWCSNASISVNGQATGIECKPGTFASVDRKWKPGDRVEINMPMDWRLVEGRKRQAGRAAVMRGPQVFCLNPSLNGLDGTDGADLGKFVIDKKSIEASPVSDQTVRPGGIACRLKADNRNFSMGNGGNLLLNFTEFADPGGKCIYFRLPDLSEAVKDELCDLW